MPAQIIEYIDPPGPYARGEDLASFNRMKDYEPEAWSDFSNKPNGAAPPALDSGQVATVYSSSSPLQISNGRLGYSAGVSGAKAGYLSAKLSGAATRIGATFTFTGGSTNNGAVAILMPVSTYVHGIDVAAHLIVTPTLIYWQVREAPGSFVTVFTHYYASALAKDGTEYTVEAQIDGSTVTLYSPDGSIDTFSDPLIASNNYGWVTWEPFQADVTTDTFPEIVELWADSGGQATRRVTGMDLKKISDSMSRRALKPTVIVHAPTSDNVTVTTTPAEIASALRTTLFYPDSGRVLVEYYGYVVNAGGAAVYVSLYADAGLASNVASRVVAGGAHSGPAYFGVVMTGAPGTFYPIYFGVWRIGGSDATLQQNNSGYASVVKITPL